MSPSDSVRWRVRRGGRGRPCLFIHGAATSGAIFRSVLSRLTRLGLAYLAPDLPGHGGTPGPPHSNVEALADVLSRRFGQDCPPRGWWVVGHSLGGLVALQLAHRHRELVRGLLLVCTGARIPVSPALLDSLQQNAVMWRRNLTAWGFSPTTPKRIVDLAIEMALETPLASTRADFEACAGFDGTDFLDDLDVPAVVMGSTEDRLVPFVYSEELANMLPLARLAAVKDAGHMVPIERPEVVCEALKALIS